MMRGLAVFACIAGMGCSSTARVTASYRPRGRVITITTVPLLVKEEQSVLPFLREDFAKGGVLDGKEVYAFSPSTITVEGPAPYPQYHAEFVGLIGIGRFAFRPRISIAPRSP